MGRMQCNNMSAGQISAFLIEDNYKKMTCSNVPLVPISPRLPYTKVISLKRHYIFTHLLQLLQRLTTLVHCVRALMLCCLAQTAHNVISVSLCHNGQPYITNHRCCLCLGIVLEDHLTDMSSHKCWEKIPMQMYQSVLKLEQ